MSDTETSDVATQRHTYGGWQALGRQVRKGQRSGFDRKFTYDQTKAAGAGRSGPRTCKTCGCRIRYGVYCGKCEYS